MKGKDIAVLTILILSLLGQGVDLAAAGMAEKTLDSLQKSDREGYLFADTYASLFFAANGRTFSSTMYNFPTAYQRNKGYIRFCFAAASISALIYVYLIIVKLAIIDHSRKLRTINMVILATAIMLQFAMGTAFAIALTNNYDEYHRAIDSKPRYQALNRQQTVDLLDDLQTTHDLTIAATAVSYAIGFLLGLVALFLEYREIPPEQIMVPIDIKNPETERQL